MSRTQQQLLQHFQYQPRNEEGQTHAFSHLNFPSTAHSCENPFRFVSNGNKFCFDGPQENREEIIKNQMNSSDEDIVSQRKLLLHKLKKLESRNQQNNIIQRSDTSSQLNDMHQPFKQAQMQANQKGSCFTFCDDTASQKVLTEPSVAAHFQQPPQQLQQLAVEQLQSQNLQASPLLKNSTEITTTTTITTATANTTTIQNLKAEIKAVRKELEHSEHENQNLQKELRMKIQQFEELQTEFEKINSQWQINNIRGGTTREHTTTHQASRSKDNLRSSQNGTAYQEQQKKFIDELISTNYLKDNQISHLKRELKNSYLIISKQKEEISQLTVALKDLSSRANFVKKSNEENGNHITSQLNQLKTIQTTYQTIAFTEPDMRNDELYPRVERDNEYIGHIHKLQQKINTLEEQRSCKVEGNDTEEYKTKTTCRDSLQLKPIQVDQIKSTLKKQNSPSLDQLPTSKSHISKETIDKKGFANFERKDSDYQVTQKGIILKSEGLNNNNLPEPANFGQFSLLESELFNNPQRNRDFGLNIDMESFNLSPIKNKSYKQEKSTICDKSCLQAILTIDDLSHRALKINQINIQSSAEQVQEYVNLQEELELNQNNFQNRIKKVLDMNAILLNGVDSQQLESIEQKSKEETCPDFTEFVTQLKRNHNSEQNQLDILSKRNEDYDSKSPKMQNNRYSIEQKQQSILSQQQQSSQQNNYRNFSNEKGSNNSDSSRKDKLEFKQYQSQGMQKSQSHSVQLLYDVDERRSQKKDDNHALRLHSLDSDKSSKYSKLQIGISSNNLYQPSSPFSSQNTQQLQTSSQQQLASQKQQQQQQQSELHYSMYYTNNKTKSEAALNPQKIQGSSHSKDRKPTNGGQIIKQIPHTTKETSKKFVFDSSECSVQFKEDFDDFKRIVEGKKRSSSNVVVDLKNNEYKQDYSPFQGDQTEQRDFSQHNSNQNISSKRTLYNQYVSAQSNMKNEQKSSSHSLGTTNRGSQHTSQPMSQKKKSNDMNKGLKYYENNEYNSQLQLQNYDSQVRSSTGSITHNTAGNASNTRNMRINSITENDNKHYIGSTPANKKISGTPTNNSCNAFGKQNKNDSSQTTSNVKHSLDNHNKFLHSQNSSHFVSQTPKGNQDQVTSASKKKLNNLANIANGNSYHIQQKQHHEKYDFYYQNSTHQNVSSTQQHDEQLSNKKNTPQPNQFKNQNTPSTNSNENKSNTHKNNTNNNVQNQVSSSHSSGDLVSNQNKILSNKQKKVTGMIVCTATSREYEGLPTTATSSLIRKQIASTVNEAVRNSTHHLQIIYNSNNMNSNNPANSSSNQQLNSIQMLSSTRQQAENHSIDSCTSRRQEKNHNTIPVNCNNEQSTTTTQQSYHGLQTILNQHVNKPSDGCMNSRYMSSNMERLREVKNRVRDLNLNNDSQSTLLQSKENYPPSQSSVNIINSIFQTTPSHNNPSSTNHKNTQSKGIDKGLESVFSRRSSQNNQFSNPNNRSDGQFMSSNHAQKGEYEYANDKLANLLKENTKRNVNTSKNNEEQNQVGFKRNSSYNNPSSSSKQYSSQQSNELNSIRKSDSVKRSSKQ